MQRSNFFDAWLKGYTFGIRLNLKDQVLWGLSCVSALLITTSPPNNGMQVEAYFPDLPVGQIIFWQQLDVQQNR